MTLRCNELGSLQEPAIDLAVLVDDLQVLDKLVESLACQEAFVNVPSRLSCFFDKELCVLKLINTILREYHSSIVKHFLMLSIESLSLDILQWEVHCVWSA